MAVHHLQMSFDRPLASAVLPRFEERLYTESDLAAARAAAFAAGADSARTFSDSQMVELRGSVQTLQDGLFANLKGTEDSLLAQLRTSLPGLILEIAQRLLAGFEPPAEVIEKLCREALDQLYPERENLELIVSPRDAAMLEKVTTDWASRYPGLRIRPDATLNPGDCQVHSRFGLIDARIAAKLAAIEHEFNGAA